MSKPEGSITPLGNGVFRITRNDGSQALAYGVIDGARTWVFLDGTTHVIEPSRRTAAGAGHDAAQLAAPMPATVTQIHVAVGQTVAPADLLITLEAMKMELPIRATTAATVAAINCRIGELVQPGIPLVELRNADGREVKPAGLTRPAPRTPNSEPEREPGTEPEHELRSEKREG